MAQVYNKLGRARGITVKNAGPAYVPSDARERRDQIKSFLANSDLVEQTTDKLYKIMVMDNPNGGYAKDDVKRFVTEFLLPEFDPSRDEALWRTLIENACTEVNIKISKNMRESLT